MPQEGPQGSGLPGSDVAEIGEPVWVGDFWDIFDAGDLLERTNLKAIAEYRHRHGLPVTRPG